MAGYEHALFMLLLLCYLLREISNRRQANLYMIAAGLLLVLLPPIIRFEIPWNLTLALVLPLIMWAALGSAVLLPILATILLAALHDIKTWSGQNPPNGF